MVLCFFSPFERFQRYDKRIASHYFLIVLTGNKTEASGSDSRLHMVELCTELLDLHQTTKHDQIDRMYQLCRDFADITHLAYSRENDRTPASVLAMHNLTLRFAVSYAEVSTT